jgi:hypothetical protein
MSLIKKSDVKNHLFTGAKDNLLPFRQRSQPDAGGFSNDGIRDTDVKTPILGVRADGQSSVVPPVSASLKGVPTAGEHVEGASKVKASQA